MAQRGISGHRKAGEIHWGDETALVNTDVRGRGDAPIGQTPHNLRVHHLPSAST
jgi:hypothetical protein